MFTYLKETMAPTTRSSSSSNASGSGSQKCLTNATATITSADAISSETKTTTITTPVGDAAGTESKTMKGYKITDNERTKKYGIGANSLKMLKDKASLKFPVKDLRVYLSTDGFEISDEDYFGTLQPQCLFIIAGPNEIITTDADFEFEKVREHSPLLKVADIIWDFIEQHPDKFRKMIADYENRKLRQKVDYTKTHLSLKSEHLEWFEGQEERCQSKEEAMARRAQDRMRGYYYKTKEELTRNKLYRQNFKARQVLDAVLEKFRYLLIGCDYFSMIFDRNHQKKHDFLLNKLDEIDAHSAIPNKRLKQIIKSYTVRNEILDEWSVSLCTDLGDFYCQGPYSDNKNCCTLKHTINPYASRENLILFQVWNLDHQIELARTILPALVENVRELIEYPQRKCSLHKQRVVDISVLEYFLEIFSLKNLKLVHIVCHEKVQRTNRSNGRLVCEKCHEYKIVEELMSVRSNDVEETR